MRVKIDRHRRDASGERWAQQVEESGRVGSSDLWSPPPVRLISSLTLTAVLLIPAIPASADAVDTAVNGARSTPLPVRAEVESVARASASSQAASGKLGHTSLSALSSVCSAAGEIVGAGNSIPVIFELFLQSSNHRPLLLSSNWTAMGTGAATGSDGKIYVSVVFCQETNPGSGVPQPPPPPPPPPPTAPSNPPAAVTGTVQPTFTPAAPLMPSFDEVLYRLLTGDLAELWFAISTESSTAPELGPSLFLAPAYWTTQATPALS